MAKPKNNFNFDIRQIPTYIPSFENNFHVPSVDELDAMALENVRKKLELDRALKEAAEVERLNQAKMYEQEAQERFHKSLPEGSLIEAVKLGKLDDLWQNAHQEALLSKDLETDKWKYPSLVEPIIQHNIIDTAVLNKKYEEEYNSFASDVLKILKNEKQYNESPEDVVRDYNKKDIVDDLLARGIFATEKEAEEYYDNASDNTKDAQAIRALGTKYLSGEAFEAYLNMSTSERLDFLAAMLKNNPNYKTENAKYKERLNQNWSTDVYNFLSDLAEKTGNIPGMKAGQLATEIVAGVWGIGDKIVKSLVGEATNGEEEDIDALVNSHNERFIQSRAAKLKDEYLNYSIEEKREKAKEFDALSEQYSKTYQKAKSKDYFGNLLNIVDEDATEEEILNAKLEKYAELEARRDLFGEESMANSVDEFWKDTTAKNQGALDYLLNTAGTGVTTLGADVLSVAAVASNIVNPATFTEGYSDALMKHNGIMDLANSVQKFGEEKFYTFRTAEDENSFISWRDVPDIVGQYGFTIGSKWITIGGSYAARKLSASVAKNILKLNVRGYVASSPLFIWDKNLRNTIKTGLASGKSTEEYTKALEAINQIQSKRLYNLNLAIAGAVGTGEGALNASDTYEKFIQSNNISKKYDDIDARIDLASDAELKQYMLNKGYQPLAVYTKGDGKQVIDFSPELYQLAKEELRQANAEARKLAEDRVEDDALDAACTNFIANSFINGMMNVLVKESLLSNDVKHASRNMKNQTKGVLDMIDVVKEPKGWVARVKEAAAATSKNKNIWKSIGEKTKKAGKTLLEASKTATGEMAEEWGQDVSDMVSRAAFQEDLNRYLDTVYDKNSHEAFYTDLNSIMSAGYNALGTSMASQEALKSGLFGFLSTLGGGIDYGGFVSGAVNWRGSNAKVGSKQWFKDLGKNIKNYATGLVDGAIISAYRESQEQGETAQRLAESVNTWLNNSASQELITHLGGAIGFKKSLENALIMGDDEQARDDRLNLAIENIFMLNALKDTEMAKSYQQSFEDLAALSKLTSEENKLNNFDEQDNYIGGDNQAYSALVAFKEREGKASENMTDLQIMLKVALNALEFLDLQKKVNDYSKKVENLYHEDNLDPIVQLAYVLAIIQLDKARSRKESLGKKLNGIFNDDNINLRAEDREELKKHSDLDEESKQFLITYGSISKAVKESEKLGELENVLETGEAEIKKDGKVSEATLKALKKEGIENFDEGHIDLQKEFVKFQKRNLDIAIAREQAKAAPKTQLEVAVTEESQELKDKLKSKQTEPKPIEHKEIITVGDMAKLSPRLRSAMLENKNQYSTEQQQEIDKFVRMATRLAAKQLETQDGEFVNSQEEDLLFNEETLKKDYMDFAALDHKVSAYDSYLRTYILNPGFLSSIALDLKEKLRKQVLKFYYKDALKLKPNETVYDMLDRVLEKIDMLKSNKRTEGDGLLLELIVNEEGDYNKVLNTRKEINLRVGSAMLDAGKPSNEETNRTLIGLASIALATGMDLKLIRGVFDNYDTQTIEKALNRKIKGEYLLDQQLTKAGLLPILKDNEDRKNTVLLLILNIKEALDIYYGGEQDKSKDLSDRKIEIQPVLPRELKQTDTSIQKQLEQTKTIENTVVKVTTPGDIEDAALKDFLNRKKVNSYIYRMTNPEKVKFMTTTKFGRPVTFAVVPAKTVGGKTVNKDNTFNIDGVDYQIIGVIKEGISSTLDEKTKKAYSTLPNNDAVLLTDAEGNHIEFEVDLIKDPKGVSNTNTGTESAEPLNTQLTSEDEIENWVDDFVRNGTSELKKDTDPFNPDDVIYLYTNETKSGYPVYIDTSKDSEGNDTRKLVSLFKIPLKNIKVGDTTISSITLEDFMRSEYTPLEKIQALKNHDDLFKTFFNTWRNYIKDEVYLWKDASTVYNHLIGNFICLGYAYGQDSNKTGMLNPKFNKENNKLTIDYRDHNNTLEISLPTSDSDSYELDALRALNAIMLAVAEDKFIFSNPHINGNGIVGKSSSDYIIKAKQNQLKGIIKGLIELGVLKSSTPEDINRLITLKNKYASDSRTTNANNPNLATPDNSVDESPKPKMETAIKKKLNERQLKALAIVEKILANSKPVELQNNDVLNNTSESLDEDESSYYQNKNTGTQYARTTAVESAVNPNILESTIRGSRKVMSTSHGNTVDNVVRTVIDILNKSDKIYGANNAEDLSELYQLLVNTSPFTGKIPNYSEDELPVLFKTFLGQLIRFHQLCQSKNWTIIPNGIKCFGTLPVLQDGKKVGKLPVAGTLDLLVYDLEGVFHIIDIKTKHDSTEVEENTKDSKLGWTTLINTYRHLLQQQYPEMVFGECYVLPIAVSYSIPRYAIRQGADRMTVENVNLNLQSPQADAAPSLIQDDSFEFEKTLMPIETEDIPGVNLSKLSPEYQLLVIDDPTDTGGTSDIDETPFKSKNEELKEEKSTQLPQSPSKDSKFSAASNTSKGRFTTPRKGRGNSKKSERTTKQSLYTDFINNHIAPVVDFNVNFFGKITLKLQDFLKGRDGTQALMLSDLANTFFQGNVTLLKNILGNIKITSSNMPIITNKIKSYFENYISNELILISNVLKRLESYKALYDYLKGNITEQQFLEELYRLNVSSDTMPELIDYINSTDQDNERRRIILKLETSTIHTPEDAEGITKALKDKIDNMKTKLEFLSSSSASDMLDRRLQSIKMASEENKYSALDIHNDSSSMNRLLKGENGVYGADKLLTHIKMNSKNTFFKLLAGTLQSYIRQSNLLVTVSLEDQILNVEGESRGRNITIYKDSLSSYERLERVLLHEMLHSVLLMSPEINSQLNSIIEKATANLARTTGKSIKQVKSEYYGFKNADEFVSEFFTNYAFLELLKTITDSESNNITDRIILKILSIFGKKNTAYSQAYKSMQQLLRENSLESLVKTDLKIEDMYYMKHTFKNLKKGVQKMIQKKGISEDEFNNMTALEQNHLEECCK